MAPDIVAENQAECRTSDVGMRGCEWPQWAVLAFSQGEEAVGGQRAFRAGSRLIGQTSSTPAQRAKAPPPPDISTGTRCSSASITPDAAGASVLTATVSEALPRRRRGGHESHVKISQLCCHKGSIVTKEEEYRGNPHKMWIATIFFLFGAYKSKSYMPHRASFLPQLPMKHSSPPGASACYGSLAARR